MNASRYGEPLVRYEELNGGTKDKQKHTQFKHKCLAKDKYLRLVQIVVMSGDRTHD